MSRFFITLYLLVSFLLPVVSFSAGEYTVLAPLPNTTSCEGNTGVNCKADLFSNYLPGMFNLAIGAAFVLAFLMITFGGFMYATSDAILKKNEGKNYITNALWGLGLVVGAWALLNTINPQILSFKLDLVQPTFKFEDVAKTRASNRSYPIAGYDIGPYATAAWHETTVNKIYNEYLKNFDLNNLDTKKIDEYIQKHKMGTAPAPVTGEMVKAAAQKYFVDYKLMLAIMEADSHFGTDGCGQLTLNPGNIGNTSENCSVRKYFPSWAAGVEGVAVWLNANRIK